MECLKLQKSSVHVHNDMDFMNMDIDFWIYLGLVGGEMRELISLIFLVKHLLWAYQHEGFDTDFF